MMKRQDESSLHEDSGSRPQQMFNDTAPSLLFQPPDCCLGFNSSGSLVRLVLTTGSGIVRKDWWVGASIDQEKQIDKHYH